jgi:hypothetical protein
MKSKEYFPVGQLSERYDLEVAFFRELWEIGLVELDDFEGELCIHQEALYQVEKIIRIHRDLHVNLEGIDVVMNILRRQEELEAELLRLTNKLRRYDDHY